MWFCLGKGKSAIHLRLAFSSFSQAQASRSYSFSSVFRPPCQSVFPYNVSSQCPLTNPDVSRITWCRHGGVRTFIEKVKPYDIFGNGPPGDEEYRKAWEQEMDEETCCWTGSDSEDDRIRAKAVKEHYGIPDSESSSDAHSDDKKRDATKGKNRNEVEVEAATEDEIEADCSDELKSVWSGSDEDKTLWSGSEDDLSDDGLAVPRPNERSDRYLDQIFEFEEKPKLRTLSELFEEDKQEELNPGRKARKIAFENALKKLKKGPDGRYTNVFDVITDIDVLIGSFEELISGPEYADLRAGGPKKLNMEFFKDLQQRLRNGTYQFSPIVTLKPKSRFVSKKKYLKAMAREKRRRRR